MNALEHEIIHNLKMKAAATGPGSADISMTIDELLQASNITRHNNRILNCVLELYDRHLVDISPYNITGYQVTEEAYVNSF